MIHARTGRITALELPEARCLYQRGTGRFPFRLAARSNAGRQFFGAQMKQRGKKPSPIWSRRWGFEAEAHRGYASIIAPGPEDWSSARIMRLKLKQAERLHRWLGQYIEWRNGQP